MITAYVDQTKQDDWDEYLPYLALAYNTSVHCTTKYSSFEAMFGRTPKLPIDQLYPQINTSRISLEDEISPIPGLDVLDEHRTFLKPDVEENIASLRRHLKYIGAALIHNRDLVMEAKATYDRRIKKESCRIGDWVLCSHPKIAKGMRKGIAFKYYASNSTEQENTKKKRKTYTKNPDNPRWNKDRIPRSTIAYPGSDTEPQKNFALDKPERTETDEDTEETIKKQRRPYTKNPNNSRWHTGHYSLDNSVPRLGHRAAK